MINRRIKIILCNLTGRQYNMRGRVAGRLCFKSWKGWEPLVEAYGTFVRISRCDLNFWARTRAANNRARSVKAVVAWNGTERWDRRQRETEELQGNAPGLLISSLKIEEHFLSSLLLSLEQVSLATDGTFSSFLANLASQLLTLAVFGNVSWLALWLPTAFLVDHGYILRTSCALFSVWTSVPDGGNLWGNVNWH